MSDSDPLGFLEEHPRGQRGVIPLTLTVPDFSTVFADGPQTEKTYFLGHVPDCRLDEVFATFWQNTPAGPGSGDGYIQIEVFQLIERLAEDPDDLGLRFLTVPVRVTGLEPSTFQLLLTNTALAYGKPIYLRVTTVPVGGSAFWSIVDELQVTLHLQTGR